jgi:phosphate butyryltransferase
MMTSFEQIRKEAAARGRKRIILAPAGPESDFAAVMGAVRSGTVSPIFVGDPSAIESALKREGLTAPEAEIIPEPDSDRALGLAIGMLKSGKADLLMRGSMAPQPFLAAILEKEKGLLKERLGSLVSVFNTAGAGRLTMLTDTYINNFPGIVEKVAITENVVRLAGVLGLASPRIAAVSAIEQVNPAIPSTLDAAILSKMAERRQFGNVTLEGPLDIDCAVSRKAADRKGVRSPVTGQADIYLAPNVEVGYLMAQVFVLIGKTPMACALMGMSHPVVLNLPFVALESRETEIDLAVLLCERL